MVTVGIDLGTSNSCVAVWDTAGKGKPVVLQNVGGQKLTPSCVALESPRPVIGENARMMGKCVFDSKRLMGEDLADERVTMRAFAGVIPIDRDGYEAVINDETCHFLPEEIAALVLRRMREDVKAALQTTEFEDLGTSDTTIITVPAYFTAKSRQATKDAGEMAGWKVACVINEPTAAALAFVYKKMKEVNDKILAVFDLGGGTFDVSIIKVERDCISVLATAGDARLGGSDFTDQLVDHLRMKLDVELSGPEKQRLREQCETAKKALSTSERASVLLAGKEVSITRAEFEELIAPSLDRCRRCINSAKEKADDKLFNDELRVDKVLLVGGSTRIPAVRELVKTEFEGLEPDFSLNADEAIALGAAVYGAWFDGVKNPYIETVALSDVTPLPLGIEVTRDGEDKLNCEIVPANTVLPAKMQYDNLTTADDNQKRLEIKLLQGGARKSYDCAELGRFFLEDLPPLPQGVPRFRVEIEVIDDGTCEVTADMADSAIAGQIKVKTDRLLPDEFKRSAACRVEAYFAGNMTSAQTQLTRPNPKKRAPFDDIM